MPDLERRRLLKVTGTAVAILPVTGLFGLSARADELPMVDPAAPQAQALQYIAESAIDGKLCSGCALYQGTSDDKAAACALFPGQNVAAAGWCSAWVPKA